MFSSFYYHAAFTDSAVIVDLSEDVPDDISVSLWQLGGHLDLMPAFFHFLSREAIYILTFDLQQDLHGLARKTEWRGRHSSWTESEENKMM